METERMSLFRHQRQLIRYPWMRPEIEYFFLIGGYGCGKTSGDVFLILSLCKRYFKQSITIGLGGTTITLLRKTLVAELQKILIMMDIPFTDDKNSNIIKIGAINIVLIATEQPQLLYAYNFNIFICDEIDELPAEKCLLVFTAIQERTRKVLPDGRIPFSVFTTTAQGYSGTYAIVENLKRLKQRFVLIRGLTRDNTSLSKTYVERLYSLYDDNERLAYLEGRFVNLNTGRVYGDYDASVNLAKKDYEIDPVQLVMIGQDLNTGFSKGVALMKNGTNLNIVKTFSFAQIAHAPKIIRNAFPLNDIFWYPDASSKEVMTGYLDEIRSHDIQLRMGSVNPSVVERIFFVNKLFKTNRMEVGRSCIDLDIALKTRQYDDTGKPEKGKGTLAPDHLCVTGDTLVYTSNGEKCIRDIVQGDMVLTREGYKEVLVSANTGRREVKNVFGVMATNDHPFYNGREFVQADCLNWYDVPYVLTRMENLRCRTANLFLLCLMERRTQDNLKLNRDATGFTTIVNTAAKVIKTLFTDVCGCASSVMCLKGSLFTISMATSLIMRYLILNVSMRLNTCRYTQENLLTTVQDFGKRVLKRAEKRQKRGIAVLKVLHGISNRLVNLGLSLNTEKCASIAARRSQERAGVSSALKTVFLRIAECVVLTARNVFVKCVEKSIRLASIQMRKRVRRVARQSSEQRETDVYNLTVSSAHEFFANGVLVSNCDGLEYSVWRIVSADKDFNDLWQLSRTARLKTPSVMRMTA